MGYIKHNEDDRKLYDSRMQERRPWEERQKLNPNGVPARDSVPRPNTPKASPKKSEAPAPEPAPISYRDKRVRCAGCGKRMVYTAKAQKSSALSSGACIPRCVYCRQKISAPRAPYTLIWVSSSNPA